MLLVIDAGNTNTVFAVFDNETLKGQWRISANAKRTADEYAVWLNQLLHMSQISPPHIQSVIISTVVPQNMFALKSLCRKHFSCEPLVVGEEGVKTGIEVKLDRPSEVGADRLVDAVAVFKKFGGNALVIDFGTATTFNVVGKNGEYMGGVIAPGIHLSIEALRQATAKLPGVDIVRPKKVIGTNTVEAMQAGIYWGYLGLIEGIVQRIRAEYGAPMTVVATGGLAPLFFDATEAIDHLEPDLTIYGLLELYNRNS